ncbi:MAG TPA: hypothetical protein VJQ06_05525 [Rhizomicrobium sp.]|nr:hypothetical protein [Rhizomicrobium sp.]
MNVEASNGGYSGNVTNNFVKNIDTRKVPDCTERTNLRKWGAGDMFFTYVTRVCLEQKRAMVGGVSQVSPSYGYRMSQEQRSMAVTAAAAKARELRRSGMGG